MLFFMALSWGLEVGGEGVYLVFSKRLNECGHRSGHRTWCPDMAQSLVDLQSGRNGSIGCARTWL